MVVKMALYGLKSSGAAFRAKLASNLHDMSYTPSKLDPYVWMRPAIKSDGTEYYKYSLVYVEDVLVISCVPMKKIEGIKCHIIFDIKLGENFCRKARLVGGGHITSALASITY